MFMGTAGGATGDMDKRIIPGCGLIRRLRLDELPQLYNILIGNMSLIGPRPEAIDLVKWYRREIREWDYRTLILPGITGWAQVNSGYTSNPSEARVKLSYDLYYIKHLSFDLDLQILFKTIRTVLLGMGAR
jgi:lipopolysaccharide/colanic/teichoic acid biosynthesis glycosyltransferase